MPSVRNFLKKAPLVSHLKDAKIILAGRHRMVIARALRTNTYTTAFQRCPSQFKVLVGPVLAYLLCGEIRPLHIVEFGCSTGAESYSIASELLRARPDLEFEVHASDLEDWVMDIGRERYYTAERALKNRLMTRDFFEFTFEPAGDGYRVRDEIANRVTFAQADVLDPGVVDRYPPADVLYAQNFLYHLERSTAELAFDHMVQLLKPRAAVFIDGMDLGLKEKLVKRYDLHVVDHLIEEIHEDARAERGQHWPRHYWGLEPLSKKRHNWKVRYGTVFTTTPNEAHA